MMAQNRIDGMRKNNAISLFFQKNKSLKVLLPVLAVAIFVLILVNTGNRPPAKPASAETQHSDSQPHGLTGQAVEILPQMERVTKPDVTGGLRDPFDADVPALVLKGITLSNEKSTAIIESEDRVQIVSVGDPIGDRWKVEKIDATGVVLKGNEGTETTLSYDP